MLKRSCRRGSPRLRAVFGGGKTFSHGLGSHRKTMSNRMGLWQQRLRHMVPTTVYMSLARGSHISRFPHMFSRARAEAQSSCASSARIYYALNVVRGRAKHAPSSFCVRSLRRSIPSAAPGRLLIANGPPTPGHRRRPVVGFLIIRLRIWAYGRSNCSGRASHVIVWHRVFPFCPMPQGCWFAAGLQTLFARSSPS